MDAKGMAAAESARGFFGVQLEFAEALARAAGMPLAEAVTWHTNLHRLFAYGNLSKQAPDLQFVMLVSGAVRLPAPARLDALIAAYAQRPYDPWPADRHPFGPHFACEAPNEDGAVRIHFRNRVNRGAVGPLDRSNIAQRRAELAGMFAHVARTWPQTKSVIGGSWLYNTEGYRRLFPAAYVESRKPLEGPRSIHGLSSWGQFVDFRGAVKSHVADAFRSNLATLDPAQPWLAFPYPVLMVSAPFEAFREEYSV